MHAVLEIKKAGLIVESIYLARFLVFSILCVRLRKKNESELEFGSYDCRLLVVSLHFLSFPALPDVQSNDVVSSWSQNLLWF